MHVVNAIHSTYIVHWTYIQCINVIICAVCFSLYCKPFSFYHIRKLKNAFQWPKNAYCYWLKEEKSIPFNSELLDRNQYLSTMATNCSCVLGQKSFEFYYQNIIFYICKIALERKRQINPIPLVPCVLCVCSNNCRCRSMPPSQGAAGRGGALLPWAFFPPNVNKMNSYAIHGSGAGRTYEALHPVPREDLVEGQKPNLWVNWSVCLWLWIFVLFLGDFVWCSFWRGHVLFLEKPKLYLKCKTNTANKADTNLLN